MDFNKNRCTKKNCFLFNGLKFKPVTLEFLKKNKNNFKPMPSQQDGGGFGTYDPDELIFYPPQKEEPQKELRRSEQLDFYNEPDPDNPPKVTCYSYGSNNGCDEYCPILRAGKCEFQNAENAELYKKSKKIY